MSNAADNSQDANQDSAQDATHIPSHVSHKEKPSPSTEGRASDHDDLETLEKSNATPTSNNEKVDEHTQEPPRNNDLEAPRDEEIDPPPVKIIHSKRRGILGRFTFIAEVEEPKHYDRKIKWFITFTVAFAAIAAPMGSAIIFREFLDIHSPSQNFFANCFFQRLSSRSPKTSTPHQASPICLQLFSYSQSPLLHYGGPHSPSPLDAGTSISSHLPCFSCGTFCLLYQSTLQC